MISTTILIMNQIKMKMFYIDQGDYINDSPKDSFSILVERLDTLQNFLLGEISDIKAKIKNNCNQKASKEISARNDEKAAVS